MFSLNICDPKINCEKDNFDSSLGEVIETVFYDFNDSFEINWNGVIINVSYKYDLNIIVNDIFEIMAIIRNNNSGSFNVHWPSNTFLSTWNLNWADGYLEIEGIWTTVDSNIDELNSKKKLIISTSTFQLEFLKLLSYLYSTLIKCGYTKKEIKDMSILEDIVLGLTDGNV